MTSSPRMTCSASVRPSRRHAVANRDRALDVVVVRDRDVGQAALDGGADEAAPRRGSSRG